MHIWFDRPCIRPWHAFNICFLGVLLFYYDFFALMDVDTFCECR